jgi:hypothetical protein
MLGSSVASFWVLYVIATAPDPSSAHREILRFMRILLLMLRSWCAFLAVVTRAFANLQICARLQLAINSARLAPFGSTIRLSPDINSKQ